MANGLWHQPVGIACLFAMLDQTCGSVTRYCGCAFALQGQFVTVDGLRSDYATLAERVALATAARSTLS